jgi:hypothetical protein
MDLISPAKKRAGDSLIYELVLAGFFAGCFLTRSIPHLGHLPGLLLITSGCIRQVYCTFAGLTFFVFVVSDKILAPGRGAANTDMLRKRMAMATGNTFFMDL